MQNKNLDGVSKPHSHTILKPRPLPLKLVKVDSIIKRHRPQPSGPRLRYKQTKAAFNFPSRLKSAAAKAFSQKRVPVLVAVLALFVAFGAGVWATLDTSKSAADNQSQVLGAATDVPALAVQPSSPLGQIGNLPNNVMFNMTLAQLEEYLNQVTAKAQKDQQAQILEQRVNKLKQYLQDKGSPLAQIAPTIAGLKHWQMVLAISNSESSLGRSCAGPSNNCSGIGGAPGDPTWRSYASKAEWAKDLDKLIEKRYKDWSLEQMNGTYNKPGSANWIFAAKQILEDLQARGIE